MKSDDELIDTVIGGDSSAFAELVRRYERAAAATAWNVLCDFHAVQDATQNAFVEAFRHLNTLLHPEHFGAWLMQITRREALRMASQTVRTRPLEPDTELATIDTPGALTELCGELLAAIGSLPEQERVVVGLRYLDGHTVSEIARLTGRPVGTVTKQLSRAVERLKSILRKVRT